MGVARRRGGGEGGVAAGAGDDDAELAAASGLSSGSGSSSTMRSPASSSLTDEGGEVTSTSLRNWGGGGGDCSFSSSESEEEMMQLDGDGHADGGDGPLYELAAPLLAQLPVRTGLSKYYQGKSQSFTSLCNARCVEDLAKKTTPYITRMKLHRGHGVVADRLSNSCQAPGPCSKTMAKKTPRCLSDRLLSRARSTSLFTAAAAHLHSNARNRCQDAT
ncbi:hypothetical protein E2562_006481 [Oryza meyeriana var. granulata]|uniref:Uncharacterized protein n=1 Tax=Oryza meyeriana var. granulata TaxID=110450 RepID=A0A6G1CPW6_9ORYZ|nr:hypothetical protein E2562_006481 [Oryza meyeriana var. granulata]